ncbi:MAG TPA: NADPH-dependent FMN reductase [Acidobacteriaceae bacterium]
MEKPFVVGIGGTTVEGSSTERALSIALRGAELAGARTRMFGGPFLASLPFYQPKSTERTSEEHEFVAAVRQASGIILASPGYHGSVSGLVKNALDLIEETAKDSRPYLNDLPVGIVVTAYGWQAIGSTIAALRSIAHGLRGWPTPYAAGVNSMACRLDAAGGCSDPEIEQQLLRVGLQVGQRLQQAVPAMH